MVRICIDGFNLALPRPTGIGNYGRSLLDALSGVGHEGEVLFAPDIDRSGQKTLDEAALFAPPKPGRLSLAERVGRETRTLGRAAFGAAARPLEQTGKVIWPGGAVEQPAARQLWSCPHLFRDAKRVFHRMERPLNIRFKDVAPPSAMHWTSPIAAKALRTPNIYTIHDLVPLRLPSSINNDKRRFYALCRTIARSADVIATISETSRNDIIDILGIEPERVVNTYQSSPYFSAKPPSAAYVEREVESNFDLPYGGYFLHVGTVEPKKNLGRIIEAYLASGVKTPLVIVKSRGWLEHNEFEQLEALRRAKVTANERVRIFESLPSHRLANLLSAARSVIFPSLYEGFGLPVLEAMIFGVPVLTSQAGALGEITGGAAIEIDPYDTEALAAGIRQLDADEDLRLALSLKGLERAQFFSPENYHSRLARLYSQVL